jgi:hypothetical protein
MKMMIHQHVGMKAPTEDCHRFFQQFTEVDAVPDVAINGAPFVAARGDVMPCSRAINAGRSGPAPKPGESQRAVEPIGEGTRFWMTPFDDGAAVKC